MIRRKAPATLIARFDESRNGVTAEAEFRRGFYDSS